MNPTQDVVVRIYEIECDNNTQFTVSLSMPITVSMRIDRDSHQAIGEAYKRAAKVMKRDGLVASATSARFIRERLIPASKANKKDS